LAGKSWDNTHSRATNATRKTTAGEEATLNMA
jgi:hypothetical protein